MNNQINLLNISFDQALSLFEIPKFRGAVISKVPNNPTFHNHTKNGYLYRYPLIQYKRLRNKACIVCLNSGMDSIGQFLSNQDFSLNIGNRIVDLTINDIAASKCRVKVWDHTFYYSLRKWLPINQKRYLEYELLTTKEERYAYLESILIGNILSFAKSLGIWFDERVYCKIVNMDIEPRVLLFKGAHHLTFDLSFETNVSLPNYIGLGKGASMGFGMITKKQTKK